MNYLFAVLFSVAVLAIGNAAARAAPDVDTPDYTIERQQGEFELRRYPELVVAQIEEDGRRQAAVRRAFPSLARYIFAKDRPGDKIAMTAPVMQVPSDRGWVVAFIMPDGYQLTDLPTPTGDISLETETPRRVAAIRFSGRWTDARFAKATDRLQTWIDSQGLRAVGPPEFAYYNDPFTLPNRRRNEVLIEVAP